MFHELSHWIEMLGEVWSWLFNMTSKSTYHRWQLHKLRTHFIEVHMDECWPAQHCLKKSKLHVLESHLHVDGMRFLVSILYAFNTYCLIHKYQISYRTQLLGLGYADIQQWSFIFRKRLLHQFRAIAELNCHSKRFEQHFDFIKNRQQMQERTN